MAKPLHIEKRTLCEQCRNLDIPALFESTEDIPWNGIEILDLWDRYRETDCELCRFFLESAPHYDSESNPHIYLRLFDRIEQRGSESVPGFVTPKPLRFLSSTRRIERDRYDYSAQDVIAEAGLLTYQPKSALQTLNYVKKLCSPRTDFVLLNQFLSECQGAGHHACEEGYDSKGLDTIYVVDCDTMNIVRTGIDSEYLALSYRWGYRSNEQIASAEGLRWPPEAISFNTAPLTIQDAITVTLRLGKKFLWIDRYCVDQNESLEKEHMVENMDIIYGRALATIVAASAVDDTSGLPGVSKVPRNDQHQFDLAEGSLLSTLPPVSTVLPTGTWMTRGWTFQEARLSHRCLFFTDRQTYFVCREGCRSEVVPSAPESNWISWLLNRHRLDSKLFGQVESVTDSFHRDRLAYSQRELSRSSDILNAFRGILKSAKLVSYWGIPLTTAKDGIDADTCFALGLLWAPSIVKFRQALRPRKYLGSTRRAGFPTWSWTSIQGEIRHDTYDSQSAFGVVSDVENSMPDIRSSPVKFRVHVKGTEQNLAQIIRTCETSFVSEESRDLRVIGDLVKVVRHDARGAFYYKFEGRTKSRDIRLVAHLDLDEDITGARKVGSKHEPEDALIMVDWADPRREDKTRIVLMLLRWVEHGRAERKGLLSEFRTEYDHAAISTLQRRSTEFILQ